MRILIATDAWRPQVNGVVHTLEATALAAEALGAKVAFLTPEGFPSIALPSYPDIRVALPSPREIARRIADIRPDAIHVATEGPIGYLIRRDCLIRRRAFTTSLHTRFADYLAARWPVPEHGPGAGSNGSTMPDRGPWCRPLRWRKSFARTDSAPCCGGREASTRRCSIRIAPEISA
jgi:hypothetical protein